MEFIVYILHSENLNKYYIGFTENLNQRLEFHLHDTQARKFTYKADDWELVFKINCVTKQLKKENYLAITNLHQRHLEKRNIQNLYYYIVEKKDKIQKDSFGNTLKTETTRKGCLFLFTII